MDLWAPSPSPIALFLLGLDERGADGAVEVGERTLVLRRGRIVDVRRAEGDPSLHEFLQKSGRIDEAGLAVLRAGSDDPDRLPADSTVLSADALSETMRALWLDRLVRGIARAESEGRAIPSLRPSAAPAVAPVETALVPLVLDALERRAAEGDAEQVGARASHRLEWRESPHTARARRWAGIDVKSELRIGALLTSAPAAASRIAALVRAGLARVMPPGTSAPAPARRLISISPPAIAEGSTRIATAPLPSRPDPVEPPPYVPPPSALDLPVNAAAEHPRTDRLTFPPGTRNDNLGTKARGTAGERGAPARAPTLRPPGLLPPPESLAPSRFQSRAASRPSSLPPPRAPRVQLSPGAAQIFEHIGELASQLPDVPAGLLRLDDPLDAIEREIAVLEESAAAPEERAAAWLRAAETWKERYGSTEEHERALREAAAAMPEDPRLLLRAADACTACARTELALAYGRAAVAAALEGEERDDILMAYAALCRRVHRPAIALAACEAVSEKGSRKGDAHEMAASIHAAQDRLSEAANELCHASGLFAASDPGRSAFELRAAWCFALFSEEVTERLLHVLEGEGRVVAAIGLESDAAERSTDNEARRRLRIAAAQRAEQAGKPLWEADLLLRAFDDEPALETLHAPLDAALLAAGALLERAVVLEELATAAPIGARVLWTSRAADARLEIPDDGLWELELRLRCLELEPEDQKAMLAVRRQSEAAEDPRLLADALERVGRAKVWSSDAAKKAIFEELASLAEGVTNEPLRAAWARSIAASIGAPGARVRGLTPSTRPIMQRAAELERMSRQGDPQDRRRAQLELASILGQDPERRDRAVALLKELLEETWDHDAGDLLERIFTLRGDLAARISIIRQRLENEPRRVERVRRLLWIASLEAGRGEHREAARACLRILEEVPNHREALVRLRRAASRLSDGSLLLDALEREARLELPSAERARAFSSIAARAEAAKDYDAALRHAAMALELDAQAGEAAWILARRLTKSAAVSDLGIERAAALIGHAPPLLAAEIRAAETESMRLLAAERWSALAPNDAEPWTTALLVANERSEVALIERATNELVSDPRADAAHAEVIQNVLASLVEHGEVLRATSLAIAVMDRFGESSAGLREIAATWVEQAHMPRLRTEVLERRLTTTTEADAISILWALADHHQSQGDLAGEARALLRLLARAPRDGAAIERLAPIYAKAGEHDRWMAVLALRISESAGEAERFEGWLALAGAAATTLSDTERAESFARSAIADLSVVTTDEELARVLRVASVLCAIDRKSSALELLATHARGATGTFAGCLTERAAAIAVRELGDLPKALELAIEGLLLAPSYKPLLLAVEHLALELDDVEGAERAYEGLIARAMGASGERALLYRRARWLERGRREAAALEAYLEAAAHSASSGVVLSAIERLARATGDLDALARGLLLLAENAPHPIIRLGMRRRAAKLLEEEIGRPERAWSVLFPVWKQTGLSELEDDLGRLAHAMNKTSADAGKKAFDALFLELERRAADAWIAEEKARLLMKSARLHALFREDLTRAEADARAALSHLRTEDVEPTKLAAALIELAGWLRGDPARWADAKAYAAEAIAVDPKGESGRELAATLELTAPEPPASGGGAFAAAPPANTERLEHDVRSPSARPVSNRASRPPVALPETDDQGGFEPGMAGKPALTKATAPSVRPPIAEPVSEEAAVEEGVNAPDAAPEPTRALISSAIESAESIAQLRSTMMLEPWRMDVLKSLREQAARSGASREASLASAIISVAESASHQVARDVVSVNARAIAADREILLRDPLTASGRALLRALWESALPIFKVTIAQLGVLGTDRVGAHSSSLLGRSLAKVLESLPDDTAVFASQLAETAIVPVRTQPPAVLVGSDAPSDDEGRVRFLLGRALELARPEHALVATFGEEEGRTFFGAVRAAFGPAEEAQIERDAAAVAAALWRTIPARNQRDIRELVLESEDIFDWKMMRDSAFAGAARAGLVASGDLAAGIRSLLAEPGAVKLNPVNSMESLGQAIAQSAELSALVRFAFSDVFLAAIR